MASKEPKKSKEQEQHEEEREDGSGQEEEPQEATALFDQPLVLEGKRKRKSVEMFAFSTKSTPPKKPEYQAGDGVKLGDIAIVKYNIDKTKSDDLKLLYKICYDTSIAISNVALKKNLRSFSGWTFDEESEEYIKRKAQLEKLLNVNLQYLLDFLGLEKSGTKEEMIKRILNYLSKPYDTGKAPPTPRKRKSSSNDAKESKKRKTEDGDEEKEEEEEENTTLDDSQQGGDKEEDKEVDKMEEEKDSDKNIKETQKEEQADSVAMETQNEAGDKVTNDTTTKEGEADHAPQPVTTSGEGGAKEE